MFISVPKELKWCHRCWLIEATVPIQRAGSHLPPLSGLNALLSVSRTFVLLESTECPVSLQCSWIADEFLDRCSFTLVPNKRDVCPTYSLSHCSQWMWYTVPPFLRLSVLFVTCTTFTFFIVADEDRLRRTKYSTFFKNCYLHIECRKLFYYFKS